MSSTEGTTASASQSTEFAQLVPSAEQLRTVAAAALRRLRETLRRCADELAGDPERPLLDEILAALPDDPQAPAADENLDTLWQRVAGRTPYERLLSVYLIGGIQHDTLIGYGRLTTPAADLGAELDWGAQLDRLRDYFAALFERDQLIDDRLAMWGRRIAGDGVLWSRRLAGIADGTDADVLISGAEHGAEDFASELFANHSRRMNALSLAA